MQISKTLIGLALSQALIGCAAIGVQRPLGFPPNAAEVPVEYPWIGNSGTIIEGLELDGGLVFATRTGFFGPHKLDASDDFRLLRSDAVVWAVGCSSQLDTSVRPNAHLVCTYMPGTASEPPLTLALTSSAGRPLTGVFFAAHGTWTIEGVMLSDTGTLHPDTVGYTLRRAGSAEMLLFVDVAWPRMAAYAAPSLTADDRRELAPLLLAMVQVRDARMMLRDNPGGGNRVSFADDGLVAGERLSGEAGAQLAPLPPPARPGSTLHEQHAARLVELGYTDAGRALWAVLLERRRAR